jgi:adenylate cyclase
VELLHPVEQAFPDDPRIDALVAAAATHRDVARARAIAEVDSAAYGRLMIALLELFQEAPDVSPGEDTPCLGDFAQARLLALHRRVRKAAGRARGLDVGALHRLRIAIKRLRYAMEFFAPIYPARLVRRDVRRLTRLQDDLGMINDIANAGPRLALCANDHASLREAVAAVGGWYGPRYQAIMGRLPGDMQAVATHRFAWERHR